MAEKQHALKNANEFTLEIWLRSHISNVNANEFTLEMTQEAMTIWFKVKWSLPLLNKTVFI